jgi:hypothetical protein
MPGQTFYEGPDDVHTVGRPVEPEKVFVNERAMDLRTRSRP